MTTLLTVIALAVAVYIAWNIRRLRADQRSDAMKLSEQVEQMRAEQGRLSSAISAVGERIGARLDSLEAKLAAAGDVDPDLTADIEKLRSSVSQLDAILAPGSEVSASDVVNDENEELSPGGTTPNVGVEPEAEASEASDEDEGEDESAEEDEASAEGVITGDEALTVVEEGDGFTAVSESEDGK